MVESLSVWFDRMVGREIPRGSTVVCMDSADFIELRGRIRALEQAPTESLDQAMGEAQDPHPRTWFQMYDEERQRRVDLEGETQRLGTMNAYLQTENRDFESKWRSAEAEVKRLTDKYAGFEAGTLRWIDEYKPKETEG